MISKLGFFNKRGVSPLIATVLLISFAVALGSVVLTWGTNLDISKSKDICSEVSIKIRDMENIEVCYSGSGKDAYINFVIDNDGNADIEGLGIWIVGEKGIQLSDLDNLQIKKKQILDYKEKAATYDFNTYGNIKQVQFIPKVKSENGVDICPRNSVKAEKIGVC